MSEAAARVVSDGRWELSGDLNFSSVPPLWRRMAVLFHTRNPLCIDFAGVKRSDSAGLALMLEWMREARRLNKPLQFEHVPDQLQAVARSCGVAELVTGAGGD